MIINLHFVYAVDNALPRAMRDVIMYVLSYTSGFIPGFGEACQDDLPVTSIIKQGWEVHRGDFLQLDVWSGLLTLT